MLSSALMTGRNRASAAGRSSSLQLTNVPIPVVTAISSKKDFNIFFIFSYSLWVIDYQFSVTMVATSTLMPSPI